MNRTLPDDPLIARWASSPAHLASLAGQMIAARVGVTGK